VFCYEALLVKLAVEFLRLDLSRSISAMDAARSAKAKLEHRYLFYLNRGQEGLAWALARLSWGLWYLVQLAVIVSFGLTVAVLSYSVIYAKTVPEASFAASLAFEPANVWSSQASLELLGSRASGAGGFSDSLLQRREERERCLAAKKEFAAVLGQEEAQQRQQQGGVLEEGLVFKAPASTISPSLGGGGILLLAGFPGASSGDRRRNLSPAAAALETQARILCASFEDGEENVGKRTRLTIKDFSAVAVGDMMEGGVSKPSSKHTTKDLHSSIHFASSSAPGSKAGSAADDADWTSGAFGERAGDQPKPSEALARRNKRSWLWGTPASASPSEIYAELSSAIRREGLLEPGQEYEGKITVTLSEDSLLSWASMAGAYRSGRHDRDDEDEDYPLPPASFFLTVDLLAVNPDAVEEAAMAAAGTGTSGSASSSGGFPASTNVGGEKAKFSIGADGSMASQDSAVGSGAGARRKATSPSKDAAAEAGADRRVWTNPEIGLTLGAHNVLARCRKRLIIPSHRGSVSRLWDGIKRKASSAFSLFVLGPIRVATFFPRMVMRMGFGAVSSALSLVGIGGDGGSSYDDSEVREGDVFRTIEVPLSCFGGFVESSKHRTRGVKISLEPAWFPQGGIPIDGASSGAGDFDEQSQQGSPYHYFYEEGDVFPPGSGSGFQGGPPHFHRGRRHRGITSRLAHGLTFPLRWLADALAPPPTGHFHRRGGYYQYPQAGNGGSTGRLGAGEALLLHNLPPNAAEAALSAKVEFYTRMRGLAYPLYHWFWTSLFLLVATLATMVSICVLGCAAIGRSAFTGELGVGVPYPRSLGDAIQTFLSPSQERLDREKRIKRNLEAPPAATASSSTSQPAARRPAAVNWAPEPRQAEPPQASAPHETEDAIIARAQEAVAAAIRQASPPQRAVNGGGAPAQADPSPSRHRSSPPREDRMWPFGAEGSADAEDEDGAAEAVAYAQRLQRRLPLATGVVRPPPEAQATQHPPPAREEASTLKEGPAPGQEAAATGTAHSTPTHLTAGSDGTVSDTF
jgi:hypothetical protein